MAVSAPDVTHGIPTHHMEPYIEVDASGTALEVNPGDYLARSGQYAIAVHDGVAYWKASGIGVALERNPARDWAGRSIVNTALLVVRGGVTMRVSANFSGQPNLGVLAYPDMTGSGVNAASGATGLGAVWNTATPVTVSGATAAAPVKGVAQVVGWENSGPAGTGQLDIYIYDRNADYY
jgi:hypothetical protein